MDRGRSGYEPNAVLDQAMEYALAIGGMCMTEIACTYEALESNSLREMDMTRRMIEERDIVMEEVQDQLRDFDMRVAEVEERVGAAERMHDVFEAFVDGFDPRVQRLEQEVRDLQEQVGRLMVCHAVLQHGPGNPMVVDDDKEEDIEIEVPDFPAWVPGGGIGQLVPIKDEEEDELPAEVVAQQIVDDGRAAPQYEPGEDVPAYEEAPEYQIPPIVE